MLGSILRKQKGDLNSCFRVRKLLETVVFSDRYGSPVPGWTILDRSLYSFAAGPTHVISLYNNLGIKLVSVGSWKGQDGQRTKSKSRHNLLR